MTGMSVHAPTGVLLEADPVVDEVVTILSGGVRLTLAGVSAVHMIRVAAGLGVGEFTPRELYEAIVGLYLYGFIRDYGDGMYGLASVDGFGLGGV